jgi:hypothetical protein
LGSPWSLHRSSLVRHTHSTQPNLAICGLDVSLTLTSTLEPVYTNNDTAIVVGFITSAVAGPLSDWSAKWLSRRNGGRYEPEFRLYLVIGIAVFCGLGYYLFGYLISKGVSVVAISVVFGLTLVCATLPCLLAFARKMLIGL